MTIDLLRNNKVGRVVNKIDVKLRYGIVIRAVSQSYVSMVLSTALNVYTISWKGRNVNVLSNIIALIASVAMLYIPTIAYNILSKTMNINDTEFKKRYKTFIADLRTDSPLRYQFITVFFFRRAVYGCAFVILVFFPTLQIICLIATVIGMMIYLIIVRPYKSILSSLLSVVNEILLLIMVGI